MDAVDEPRNAPMPAEARRSRGDIDNVMQGDYVKLLVAGEHGHVEGFWAEVSKVTDGALQVRVDNDMELTRFHGISCDQILEVTKRNVYAVLSPRRTPH